MSFSEFSEAVHLARQRVPFIPEASVRLPMFIDTDAPPLKLCDMLTSDFPALDLSGEDGVLRESFDDDCPDSLINYFCDNIRAPSHADEEFDDFSSPGWPRSAAGLAPVSWAA